MDTSRKVTHAAGMLSAPLLYLAGRALGSKAFGRLALAGDPHYLRALQFSGISNFSPSHILQFQVATLLAAEATPEGAEHLKRLLSFSESQLLQDVFCALVLDEKREGYFLEVGVGNGKSISNTYLLEKLLGWRGLLVEPNRSSHESIKALRDATLVREAAASRGGQKLRFEEYTQAGEHSRIVGTGGYDLAGAATEYYDVDTITLNDALSAAQAPQDIDFLSLDTEGSELDILAGLDLNRYRFRVMTIEHNHDMDKQRKLGEILQPHGYRTVFPHISGIDSWYVHRDVTSSLVRLPDFKSR